MAFQRPWGGKTEKASLFHLFLFLLFLITVIRIFSALSTPLSGDEAYYYRWSHHLSPGYYDHPPMVSWTTAFFSFLGGTSPLSLRAGSIIAAFLSSLLIFHLAVNLGASPMVSFLSGLFILLIPYLNIDAIMITPNASLLLFWSLYLFLVQKALRDNSRLYWCLSGCALCLALLSKLMALFLLGTILIFLLLCPRYRHNLLKPDFYLSLMIALLVFSPFLIWNYLHQWENFHFQLVDRHRFPPVPHPRFLKDFLLLQASALSPFFFLLSIVALGRSTFKGLFHQDDRHLFCAAGALPILCFFLGVSLFERVEMYWPVAGYLTLCICAGLFIEDMGQMVKRGAQKTLWYISLALTFLGLVTLTGALYLCALNPGLVVNTVAGISDKKDGKYRGNGLIEMYAYQELAGLIAAKQAAMGGREKVFIMSDNYSLACALSYYMGEHVHIYPPLNMQGREYQRWENYAILKGMDAFFIDRFPTAEREDIKEIFADNFDGYTILEILPIKRDGTIVKTFCITHCRGFKGTWQE